MKQCVCEHWETCPICYPQGFDEQGIRKPLEVPPSREDLISRIKELEAALTKLACLGNGDCYGNSVGNDIAIAALKGE